MVWKLYRMLKYILPILFSIISTLHVVSSDFNAEKYMYASIAKRFHNHIASRYDPYEVIELLQSYEGHPVLI